VTAPPLPALEELRRLAVSHGIDRVGVASADPFPEVREQIEARVADGRSGGLPFTYSRPAVASDVRRTFPWAERLIVAGRPYLPAAGAPAAGPGQGRIARFAVDDAYVPLRRGLEAIAGRLEADGWRVSIVCDDGRLVDRAAAVRAGIGWWGKNTMVLAPGAGPWSLLGSVVTDAPLPVSKPMVRDCGACDACLPACPTGALVEPGVLDARRCIAAFLQQPGDLPVGLRTAIGDRFYGCDDCLDACPPGRRLSIRSTADRGTVDLVEILRMSDRALLERFARFYVPRRDPRYLRRNALVALGNAGTSDHVPALVAFLDPSVDPMLRRHAAWALGRIGTGEAVRALRSRLGLEEDQSVGAAIASALDSPSPSGK
jgi:epoxyqueuosine reductase